MLNLSAQNLGYKDKDYKFFLPQYLNSIVLTPEKSEEQELADERAYVEMLVASGFAVMETKQ